MVKFIESPPGTVKIIRASTEPTNKAQPADHRSDQLIDTILQDQLSPDDHADKIEQLASRLNSENVPWSNARASRFSGYLGSLDTLRTSTDNPAEKQSRQLEKIQNEGPVGTSVRVRTEPVLDKWQLDEIFEAQRDIFENAQSPILKRKIIAGSR